MLRQILHFFALVAILACSRTRPPEPMPDWLVRYLKQMDSELRNVAPANGIDADEARAIAGVYMAEYLEIGCGAPGTAVLKEGTWLVGLRVGYAGTATGETIQVDSKTGGVRAQGGPSFPDFDSFHYNVLTEIRRRGR